MSLVFLPWLQEMLWFSSWSSDATSLWLSSRNKTGVDFGIKSSFAFITTVVMWMKNHKVDPTRRVREWFCRLVSEKKLTTHLLDVVARMYAVIIMRSKCQILDIQYDGFSSPSLCTVRHVLPWTIMMIDVKQKWAKSLRYLSPGQSRQSVQYSRNVKKHCNPRAFLNFRQQKSQKLARAQS